ncbi:MAG: hypothetical protein ABSF45_29375 [Terriglobia bacterium]|jgi:hypothetical protein
MEVIIRIALMFFFIQFLVVMTIMIVALLLARPEIPLWGREPGHDALRRGFAFVIHLPIRVFRSAERLVHSMHSLRSAH